MSCSCASRGIFKSRFVIRPLGQAAAVQADARRGAAPLVGHAQLGQRVPDSARRHRVRRHRRAAVGQPDRHAVPKVAGLGRCGRVVGARQRGEVAKPGPGVPPTPDERAHRRTAAESGAHRRHRRDSASPPATSTRGTRRRRRGQRGGVPVQLGPKLVDHGDRLRERSLRLGQQLLRDARGVQVRFQRGGAGLEAVDDRLQPLAAPAPRPLPRRPPSRPTGRPAPPARRRPRSSSP